MQYFFQERTLILMAVLFSGLSSPGWAEKPDARNLLMNPSFEKIGSDGFPVGWFLRKAEGLTWNVDKEIKCYKQQSVRVTGNNVKDEFVGLNYSTQIKLKKNRVYEISGWVKGDNLSPVVAGDSQCTVLWFFVNLESQQLGYFRLSGDRGTYDWKRFSTKLTTTSSVTLIPAGPVGINGTYWLDDVCLKEVEVIPERPSVPVRDLVAASDSVLKDSEGNFALFFSPPTKKILRQMMPDKAVLCGGRSASISLAKNEHEGLQVVLAPLGGALNDVTVSLSSIRNKKNGAAVSGLSAAWNPVGYLGLQAKGRLVSEPWPDLLLPAQSFDVRANELQPIWVEVFADETVPAGDYELAVTVQPSHTQKSLVARIDIHVYDFAIPKRSTFPTLFRGNLLSTRELLYSHRLMPWDIAAPDRTGFHQYGIKGFREFDEVKPILEKCLTEYRAKGGTVISMEMPYFQGCFPSGTHSAGAATDYKLDYNQAQADYIVRYHRAYAKFLKEKGWFQDAFVYLWDEPTLSSYPRMRKIAELIHQADPDIKMIDCGNVVEELDDILDAQIPLTKNWDENRDLARKLQAKGKGIWWYFCDGPDLPYSDVFVKPEQDLLGMRLLLWSAWTNRIGGLMTWTTDEWWSSTEASSKFGTLHQSGKTTDCWWSKGIGPYELGAGSLLFPEPGLNENIESRQAIATLRLKAIRDGLEDREYLVLLEKAVQANENDPARKDQVARARQLLALPNDFTSLTQYTHQDGRMQNRRDQVAKSIEKLK
jgi:hypothetical protein